MRSEIIALKIMVAFFFKEKIPPKNSYVDLNVVMFLTCKTATSSNGSHFCMMFAISK